MSHERALPPTTRTSTQRYTLICCKKVNIYSRGVLSVEMRSMSEAPHSNRRSGDVHPTTSRPPPVRSPRFRWLWSRKQFLYRHVSVGGFVLDVTRDDGVRVYDYSQSFTDGEVLVVDEETLQDRLDDFALRTSGETVWTYETTVRAGLRPVTTRQHPLSVQHQPTRAMGVSTPTMAARSLDSYCWVNPPHSRSRS